MAYPVQADVPPVPIAFYRGGTWDIGRLTEPAVDLNGVDCGVKYSPDQSRCIVIVYAMSAPAQARLEAAFSVASSDSDWGA